jgi:hypothetical protein
MRAREAYLEALRGVLWAAGAPVHRAVARYTLNKIPTLPLQPETRKRGN